MPRDTSPRAEAHATEQTAGLRARRFGAPVEVLDVPRRGHCGRVSALGTAAGYRVIVPFARGYGTIRFLSDDALRNDQQAVLAADLIDLMDALGIEQAILAGFDWGGRSADRTTLPIGRVVAPADIAALAVHLMTNTAVTSVTFDIDGGQRLIGE